MQACNRHLSESADAVALAAASFAEETGADPTFTAVSYSTTFPPNRDFFTAASFIFSPASPRICHHYSLKRLASTRCHFIPVAFVPLLLTLLVIATIVSGCAAPVMQGDPSSMDTAAHPHSIYVVRQPWHTGIVVLAADVPANAWLARRDFPDAAYLEVGWGDRAYYQAADPDVWLGLRALFWPTPGVLHVAAFNGPVERTFGSAEILELRVSARGLARLVEVVRDSHELDASGRPIALGPGLYGASRFYASREKFHLFKTCNVWTASVLLEAGIAVSPGLAFSASNLMTQLRPSGRVIRPAH